MDRYRGGSNREAKHPPQLEPYFWQWQSVFETAQKVEKTGVRRGRMHGDAVGGEGKEDRISVKWRCCTSASPFLNLPSWSLAVCHSARTLSFLVADNPDGL